MSKQLPKPPTVTIVIRNLPVGTTEDELQNLCANCGGIVEVEIPTRVSFFTKFIFAFVRFVSLEAALNAISRLNGVVIQRRRLNVELAKSHWRNTNEKTVLHDEVQSDANDDASNLSEEELNATILQICHHQWQQHRRKNRKKGLPSFGKMMEIISKSSDQNEECYGYDNHHTSEEDFYSLTAKSLSEELSIL